MNQPECRKIMEKMEAYVAGKLPREEARKVERLIYEDPEALRIAGFYLQELAMLDVYRGNTQECPKRTTDNPQRRANGGRPEETKESFPSAKRRLK